MRTSDPNRIPMSDGSVRSVRPGGGRPNILGGRFDVALGITRPATWKLIEVPVEDEPVREYVPFETAYPPSWFAAQQLAMGPYLWAEAARFVTASRYGLGPLPVNDPNADHGATPLPVPYPPPGTFLNVVRLEQNDPERRIWFNPLWQNSANSGPLGAFKFVP